ncbi:MAG: hypothetical protein ACHP8B_10895 [Terriglobales bacterium]
MDSDARIAKDEAALETATARIDILLELLAKEYDELVAKEYRDVSALELSLKKDIARERKERDRRAAAKPKAQTTQDKIAALKAARGGK